MGDIDFDELDKAVNNLMGKVKPGKDDEPKEKKFEVKDTLKPGEEPKYDKLGEVAEKIGHDTLESEHEQTLVEHFDTHQAAEKPEFDKLGEVAQQIGHETLSTDDAKPIDVDKPADPIVEPKQEETPLNTAAVAPAPAAKRSAAGGRFMDVVHPSSDMRTGSPVAPVTPGGKGLLSHKQTVIESTPGVPSEDHGSTTPFLPDANDKVEKRPLGGAVPSPFGGGGGEDHSEIEKKDDAEPAVVETSSINNEKTDSKPETGEDDQQSIDPTEIPTEMSLEEKKLQEVESAEVAEEALEDDIMAKVESGDTEHLRDGPKEQSDSKDEQAAAIFDTKEYHKPLAHPKKQKSGWGKVLIIVLIIIIFAAAGGAAYFLLG